MAKTEAQITASPKGKRRRNRCLKKIKTRLAEIELVHENKPVRIMFQDEAGFGMCPVIISGNIGMYLVPWIHALAQIAF